MKNIKVSVHTYRNTKEEIQHGSGPTGCAYHDDADNNMRVGVDSGEVCSIVLYVVRQRRTGVTTEGHGGAGVNGTRLAVFCHRVISVYQLFWQNISRAEVGPISLSTRHTVLINTHPTCRASLACKAQDSKQSCLHFVFDRKCPPLF